MALQSGNSNVVLGGTVGIVNLLYMFLALSGGEHFFDYFFYLIFFDGAIIGAYFIFSDETAEKLYLVPQRDLSAIVGIIIGLITGIVLVIAESFLFNSHWSQASFVEESSFASTISYVIMTFLFTFVVANSEEIMFRGFLPSIAENYSRNSQEAVAVKYFVIPIIFSLFHYFMWIKNSYVMFGLTSLLFLTTFHFSFAISMQLLVDRTGTIWSSIFAHMVYNGLKMTFPVIMALGGLNSVAFW